jgi:hypothetical protein
MKTLLVVMLFGFGVSASADYYEVKTGNGRTYYSGSQRAALYVCYAQRVKYISDDGGMYLRYDGCGRYRDSCGYNGMAHFGHYPSVRASRNALHRCQNARPRFVD